MKRVVLVALFVASLAIDSLASQVFAGSGLVLKVERETIDLSCKDIPGFTPAKRASFRVANPTELKDLNVGDIADFNLVVDGANSYLRDVRIHTYQNVEQDPLAARRLNIMGSLEGSITKEVKRGDKVPDFELVDQSRRQVRFSEFEGKVVAINFVYTHCLLPNYCFRMSNNFRQLQKRFAAEMGRDLVLLTITFDPEHDSPEVLKQYAKTFDANPASWHFLTGPPAQVKKVDEQFGMAFFPDEGLMTHSLHTVVIDRRGKLVANLDGNGFTAEQLGDLVEAVMERR